MRSGSGEVGSFMGTNNGARLKRGREAGHVALLLGRSALGLGLGLGLEACTGEGSAPAGRAACGECQASCQSACKTSCTVGNQVCERQK